MQSKVLRRVRMMSADFYDPRFDSLKHVLNVLSSSNAEAELEEVGRWAWGRHQSAPPPPLPTVRSVLGRIALTLADATAGAAAILILQLREQRANIEQLVGAVVEGYHSGFNKSLHNYSQILRLFTESKLQVGAMLPAAGLV